MDRNISDINNILILGANGMLGGTIFKYLSKNTSNNVYGSIRNSDFSNPLLSSNKANICTNINAENEEEIRMLCDILNPDILINCIAHLGGKNNPDDMRSALTINARLPHILSDIAHEKGSRLIHISTDGVFSGGKGNYNEWDNPDCTDLYGKSKLLGEITESKNVTTIRTSIIGHHPIRNENLLDWLLNQTKAVIGYESSIFSGITSVELASIIAKYMIPNQSLHGIFHLASKPISKYQLLILMAEIFNKKIDIVSSRESVINRSLNANKFLRKTGYRPRDWRSLMVEMRQFYAQEMNILEWYHQSD
jgi:dTDP-4-dehydrorhamnose reductase